MLMWGCLKYTPHCLDVNVGFSKDTPPVSMLVWGSPKYIPLCLDVNMGFSKVYTLSV